MRQYFAHFRNQLGKLAGLVLCLAMLALAASLPAAATTKRVRKQPTAGHSKKHRHTRKKNHPVRGQRAIDPQRATEIQQALIREHYLTGDATGNWDSQSQAAMQKFQADNGWQTKLTPDSRALIKLGLGPKQDDGEYPTAASHTSPSITQATNTPQPATTTTSPALGNQN